MGKKLLALDYYQAPPYDVVLDPAARRGQWQALFARQAPLHVEIGMGLGQFLVTYAGRHPEMNHVGLELKMHRIYTARHKALRAGLRNLRFVPGDAEQSLAAFAPGEIGRITILFPDPWPAGKDAEKRLTSPGHVARYRELLEGGGRVHFRTDDPDLFAYACGTFEAAGFGLTVAVERERIITGFEARWLGEGRAIYGFDARL